MTRAHSTTGEPEIRLRPGIDVQASAAVFARLGRVHIPSVFPEDVAARVERALREETPWNRVFNGADKHYDLGPEAWQAIPDAKRAEIVAAVQANGRTGFAYFFENFPIADLYAAGRYRESYLMRVYEFANSSEFLDFGRQLVGAADIALADAQATCYRPGDFLTCHDDHVQCVERRPRAEPALRQLREPAGRRRALQHHRLAAGGVIRAWPSRGGPRCSPRAHTPTGPCRSRSASCRRAASRSPA